MVMMSAQHYNPKHGPVIPESRWAFCFSEIRGLFGKPDRPLFVVSPQTRLCPLLIEKEPHSYWSHWAQPLSLRGLLLEDEGERCLSFPFPLATQQPSNAS